MITRYAECIFKNYAHFRISVTQWKDVQIIKAVSYTHLLMMEKMDIITESNKQTNEENRENLRKQNERCV